MNSADHVGRCGDYLAPLDVLPVLNAVDKFMNPRRASLADRVDALEHREISDRSASCLRRSVDGTTTSTHFAGARNGAASATADLPLPVGSEINADVPRGSDQCAISAPRAPR